MRLKPGNISSQIRLANAHFSASNRSQENPNLFRTQFNQSLHKDLEQVKMNQHLAAGTLAPDQIGRYCLSRASLFESLYEGDTHPTVLADSTTEAIELLKQDASRLISSPLNTRELDNINEGLRISLNSNEKQIMALANIIATAFGGKLIAKKNLVQLDHLQRPANFRSLTEIWKTTEALQDFDTFRGLWLSNEHQNSDFVLNDSSSN